MSGPPKPEHLEADLDSIVALVEAIRADYAWAYSLGYNGRVGEATRFQQGGHGDPVASIATGDTYVAARGRCASVGRLVDEARRALQGSQTALNRALDRGARESGPAFPEDEALSALLDRKELRQAHEAKQRRHERGEDWA